MKCPKCGINLLDHIDVCPFCKTPIPKDVPAEENNTKAEASAETVVGQNTGRFSAIDTSKDSYDFDLQYTLTFRDSGEIKQAIADMDAGINRDLSKRKTDSGKKKNDEPRYTMEEMQEAALRAQERRERRKNGKKSVSHIERRKRNAMRAARPTKDYSADVSEEKTQKSHRGLLIGAGVLVIVVALIVGIVNVCSYFTHKDPEYPTVYTKGNKLYSYYDGKELEVSSNFVTIEYDASSDTNKSDSKSSSSASNKTKASDPKIAEKTPLKEKELIKISDDGTSMFFFENVNMNTRTGSLVYYKSGKKKSRVELAQNVYYDIVTDSNCSSVLFIKNADADGAHGELCYWAADKKEAISVDSDITAGNFKLSQDCLSATYIKNFNPSVHTGDLFYVSFAENAEPTKRVDEKVAFVFGTTPKGKIYFYAKNYDTKTGTYDLYIQSDVEGPKSIAEKGLLAPVISKKIESAYVFSNYSDKLQTLSCVDLSTGMNTKLSEEVTKIIKLRNDDGAVIYSKVYEEDKADYYYVNAKSPNPQKVAAAINTKAAEEGISLFDASNDFSKIAYVGGYDSVNMRGALYTMSIINDYSGSEIRISDDAYCCDVSADGAVVRFASGYNAENNTVNLVSYSNSNTLALADEVGVGAFTFDKIGEYAIYAKDIDQTASVGKINSVNKKAKIKNLDENVSAYGLKKDGMVLLLKKTGEGEAQTTSLCKAKLKGGKVKEFADNVTKVLFY